ncbi:MAG: type II secretion system protein N [Rhodocyclales bacterium]|nr:type II secretion system protein N [Rhodocyclales bacterium]
MKRRHLAAIGLAVYAAGIIAMAPATLVDAGLQRMSQGKLHLVEAHGTLWSGSGQIEIRDPGGRAGVAKSLAWRLQPESLLRGHLVGEVRLDQSGKVFPVILSLSGIELANADISLPASALGLGMPTLAPLGLTGDVLLHIAALSVERTQVRGRATLQWRNAGSVFTPISPLGDYELNFDGDGDGAAVQVLLHTLQGPLQLDGKGSWAIGANPDFFAIALVPPPQLDQLGPLLRLIAVERATGRFELQLK